MTMDRVPFESVAVEWVDLDTDDASHDPDPGLLMPTCANCGAEMDDRKCKLICRCGYFLSCSDYY